MACTLELGDDVGKGFVVGNGEGSLVAACVPIALGFVEFCPEPLEPDAFGTGGMLE